jgi:serine/threonine protein kinase
MWGNQHPNVLQFVEYFRENEKLCLVVEDCNLGKLDSLIKKKESEHFEEEEVICCMFSYKI